MFRNPIPSASSNRPLATPGIPGAGTVGAESPKVPQRRKRRIAPNLDDHSLHAPGGAQGSADILAAQIGVQVRRKREDLGWTLAQAAAWCGVGTRFLLDVELAKPNLQLQKVLDVATRFGITITLGNRPGCYRPGASNSGESVFTATAPPPAHLKAKSAWILLHHAALFIASRSGLDCAAISIARTPAKPAAGQAPGEALPPTLSIGLSYHPDRAQSLVQALGAFADSATSSNPPGPPDATWQPWTVAPPPPQWREEEGGPGLAQAFDLLRRRSAVPIRDSEQLLRWTILSNALLDTDHHLGRISILTSECGQAIQLAPMAAMLCGSKFFYNPPRKGLRIGNTWPDMVPRADHWKRLAEQAGVHPKVLFQLMREVSARVPGLLDLAFEESTGAVPSSGPLLDVIKAVRASCERMGELALAAERHTAGLTTKSQPKIERVEPKLNIVAPKRFISVVDDEEP